MKNGVIAGFLALLTGGGLAAGNRLHRAGDYAGAEAAYRQAIAAGDSSAEARYNLATSILRQGRYADARTPLERVATDAAAADLALRANYNAGNADLEPAWADSSDPAARRTAAARAVARYRRALLAIPDDEDAKWNLELALRLLENAVGGDGGEAPNDGAGGGGPKDPAPASPQASPQPSGDGGDRPPVTRAEAERILGAAEQEERELQREALRRNRGGARPARDW